MTCKDTSGANVSPTGRNNQEMSGANVSPTGRNNQEMSGANVSPTGRNNQEMTIPKHIEDALDNLNVSTSRRNVLKTSGVLVVSVSAAPLMAAGEAAAAVFQQKGPYADPDFHQLDSWVVI